MDEAQTSVVVSPEERAEKLKAVRDQLVADRQIALFEFYRQNHELTRETFAKEMMQVARLATAERNYAAAGKLYELAGKNLGAIDQKLDTHQHVHLHGNSTMNDFARASDETLMQILREAKQSSMAQAAQGPGGLGVPTASNLSEGTIS